MEIAVPLFDRFTALDAVGPYEVLSRLPAARVRFVAREPGPVRTETRMLTLVAEAAFEDVPAPDVLVVPGGIGTRSHWGARETLAKLGARPVARRVVVAGRIVTAAGVSAGIDMALTLAALIAGDDVAQAIQLELEYDPQPPFGAGSPQRAGPQIVALARRVAAQTDGE